MVKYGLIGVMSFIVIPLMLLIIVKILMCGNVGAQSKVRLARKAYFYEMAMRRIECFHGIGELVELERKQSKLSRENSRRVSLR
jgi:hypothetical protein